MDRATPNLPSRDFAATEFWYAAIGFGTAYKDDGWLILRRGTVELEFFHWPDLDPYRSNFSCCIRMDDLDSLVAQCRDAAIPDRRTGIPRMHPPKPEPSGLTIAYLVDPDGSLLRLIQNARD